MKIKLRWPRLRIIKEVRNYVDMPGAVQWNLVLTLPVQTWGQQLLAKDNDYQGFRDHLISLSYTPWAIQPRRVKRHGLRLQWGV